MIAQWRGMNIFKAFMDGAAKNVSLIQKGVKIVTITEHFIPPPTS